MKINFSRFKSRAKAKLLELKAKKNPMHIMLLCLIVLFSIIFAYHIFKSYKMNKYMQEKSDEAVTVSTYVVRYDNWTSELKTFGSLRAVLGVDVTTELGGVIDGVYFKDGQDVKKGDVLVQILADADIALLNSLEAQAKAAELTYERDKAQFAINVISKETLDMDYYNWQNLQQLYEQQAAMVDKKTLRAPFDGRIGVGLIYPGVYLNPGDPVVSLQNLSQLYIDFYMPEKYYAQLKKDQKIVFTTDAYPDRKFIAKIYALDSSVDSDSRNIHVEGLYDNVNEELLPGMYVTVNVTTGEPRHELTIPQAAVSYNPYGNIVYVVTSKIKKHGKLDAEDFKEGEDNDKEKTKHLYAEQRFVTLGELRGDQVVVLSGLKEGAEIVTSGQLKLKNHAPIVINNEVTPSNDARPDVKDEQTI